MVNLSMSIFISSEDLSTLFDASKLSDVSDKAEIEHEIESIARSCNLAANAGQKSIIWDKPISNEALSRLEQSNYKVKSDPNSAIPDSIYTISWK